MLNHTTSVRIKYIFRHAKMQIICICMYEMPYKTYFSTKRILHEKTWRKKQWWLSTIWQKHGHLILRKFSWVSMRGSLWRIMFIEAEFYKGYFITLELIWSKAKDNCRDNIKSNKPTFSENDDITKLNVIRCYEQAIFLPFRMER